MQLPALRAIGSDDIIGEIVLARGGTTLAEIEAEAVRLTLEHTRGNRSAAARMLGISRPTLARILRPAPAGGATAAIHVERGRPEPEADLDDEAIA